MDNVFKFKGDSNPKVKSRKDDSKIKFMKDKDDLKDPEIFENFIKSCEKMVRKDPRYTNYKNELFERGFNRCAFFGDITSEMATIEMHHGPIFTLFDICAVVTDALLNEGEKVNSFMIANLVLSEHEEHHVQIIMLCVTAHQAYHDGKIFLHYKQAVGDVMSFIKKYKKGIKKEHLYTMNKYLEMCDQYDATDNDFLSVFKKLEKIADK